jgi:epsilon-lactone hydrolase
MPYLPRSVMRVAFIGLGNVIMRSGVSVRLQRGAIDILDKLAPPPSGVDAAVERLGQRPAMRWAAGAEGPVVLHLHAGAYVIGSLRSHANFAAHLASACRGTVHLLDYRLAPEHPHPAAEEDAFAAARELIECHGADRLVISGDSAGGGLAVAAATRLRDAGLPQPRRLALLSPWVMLDLDDPPRPWRRDPVVREDFIRWAAKAYVPDGAIPPAPDVGGLAPMTIHVSDNEVFLPDAMYVAAQARAAGVPVRLKLLEGLWHDPHFQVGLLRDADRLVAELGAELAADVSRAA